MYFSNLEYCLKFMWYCGVHPRRNKDKLQRLMFVVNLSANCYVFLMAISSLRSYEGFHLKNFTSIMEGVITISHGSLKLIIIKTKSFEILDLLQRTESFWRTEYIVNVNLRTSCARTLHWLKITSSTMILLAISTVLMFMTSPLLNGHNGVPSRDSYNGVFDTNNVELLPVPLTIILEQYILVFAVAMPILCFDVFYQTIIILIQVQFKVLNHEIVEIFKAKGHKTSRENRIKLWVNKHNFLLDIVARMNEAFSTPLLLYFGTISLTICVESFNLTNQGKLSLYFIMKLIMYLIAGIFEFSTFYCIPAQMLIDEASRISFNTFSSYDWDTSTRPLGFSAGIIIMKGHQSVKLWIGRIAIINLETCLETIRSTFSVYMFLRTIVSKK